MNDHAPTKQSWFARHKILTGIGALVLISAIFGGVSGESDTPGATASADATTSADTGTASAVEDEPTQAADDEPTEAVEAEPADSKPEMTVSQENALSKAQDYLSMTAFSRKGLIEQLKYEGFPKADAKFAAKHVGANWNEQAAKKAQEYLDMTGFSHSGLVDQLKYEGFTRAQAEYGATQAGL